MNYSMLDLPQNKVQVAERILSATITSSDCKLLNSDLLIDSIVENVILPGVLPFMVATRFKEDFYTYRTSINSYRLRNLEYDASKLFRLFCFAPIDNAALQINLEAILRNDRARDRISTEFRLVRNSHQDGLRHPHYLLHQLVSLNNSFDKKLLGAVSTPIDLVKLMLDRIGVQPGMFLDPACGRGTFLIEIRDRLVQNGLTLEQALQCLRGNEIDERKAFIAQALIDPQGIHSPVVSCSNTLLWNDILKFDVIIGNPPFQKPGVKGSSGALWTKFAVLAHSLLKDAGILAFVTPATWLTNLKSDNLKGLFIENQVDWVLTDIKQEYFPGVASSFSAWCLRKEAYHKATEFSDLGQHIDLRFVDSIRTQAAGSMSILQKIGEFKANFNGQMIKLVQDTSNSTRHKNKPDMQHLYGPTHDPVMRPYKIRHAADDYICYGANLPRDYDKPKVALTLSGYCTPEYFDGSDPIGTVKDMSGHIVVSCQEEADNLIALICSRPYSYYRDAGRTNGMNSCANFELPLLDLSKRWTDDDLYDLIGLDEDERRIVNDFELRNYKKLRTDQRNG